MDRSGDKFHERMPEGCGMSDLASAQPLIAIALPGGRPTTGQASVRLRWVFFHTNPNPEYCLFLADNRPST